jgi:carboxyl-terminal processing protease
MSRDCRPLRRQILLASVAVVCAACGGAPPAPTSPPVQGPSTARAYLDAMVDVMQANSVNRLRLDWTSFRSTVQAAAGSAQTIPETYAAVGVALGLLDDHHSFYQKANNAGSIGNPSFPGGCSVPAVSAPALPADIGYVKIDSFSGADGQAFATAIQSAIRAQDRDGLVGWVVDLRGNGGGNMWPMLAGIGPVLGAGTVGYFVPPVGDRRRWEYRNGAATNNGATQASVPNPYEVKRTDPRVAVLTDKRVASSGEAIVVAFRGRPNTRSFGTETCGVPTANAGFTLSDGAVLTLTTSIDADRLFATYNAPIPPDESVPDTAVVQRAIDWLRSGL